eukprot:2904780-Prymnesium_polylepis.1
MPEKSTSSGLLSRRRCACSLLDLKELVMWHVGSATCTRASSLLVGAHDVDACEAAPFLPFELALQRGQRSNPRRAVGQCNGDGGTPRHNLHSF